MSDDTIIRIDLPLPADVVSSVVKAVGAMYPHSTMNTDSGDRIELRITEKDRRAGATTKGLEHDPAEGPEATVTGMKDGHLTLQPALEQEEIMHQLARIAKAMLDATEGASNYVELKVHDPETYKRFVVIAARSEKQTPHELRQAAENKLSAIAGLMAMPGQPSKKQIRAILEG